MKRWRTRPPWLCSIGGHLVGLSLWMEDAGIPGSYAVLRLGCWCTNLWDPGEGEWPSEEDAPW